MIDQGTRLGRLTTVCPDIKNYLSKIILHFLISWIYTESNSRKRKYDQEYEKLKKDEDNDAKDIRFKLERNCTFYLKKAALKLEFLKHEAKDPYMSKHNLGTDFRKGNIGFNLFKYFRSNNFKALKSIEDWKQKLEDLNTTVNIFKIRFIS